MFNDLKKILKRDRKELKMFYLSWIVLFKQEEDTFFKLDSFNLSKTIY